MLCTPHSAPSLHPARTYYNNRDRYVIHHFTPFTTVRDVSLDFLGSWSISNVTYLEIHCVLCERVSSDQKSAHGCRGMFHKSRLVSNYMSWKTQTWCIAWAALKMLTKEVTFTTYSSYSNSLLGMLSLVKICCCRVSHTEHSRESLIRCCAMDRTRQNLGHTFQFSGLSWFLFYSMS